MKKFNLFVCVSLMLVAYHLEAQDSDIFKPESGEFGLQVTASGIGPLFKDNWSQVFTNNELHLKFVHSEKRYYTLGFYISGLTDKSETRDSVQLFSRRGLRTITHSESQTSLVLIPGIESHFTGMKRIDPYISGQLPIGYVGKHKERDENMENSIKTNGEIYQNTVTDEVNTAGGFMFGLRGALGLNYYVANRISFGLNYTISLSFTKLGGDNEDTHSTKLIDGAMTTTSNTVTKGFDKNTQFEFSNKGVLGLNFLFFFVK